MLLHRGMPRLVHVEHVSVSLQVILGYSHAWKEDVIVKLCIQVDAAKVLHAEVRDVIGKYAKDSQSKHDPEKFLEKHSVFLGEARVPLAETLPGSAARMSLAFGSEASAEGGEATATKREFVLARRHGGDHVSGFITLSFEWTITAASLLQQKLRVLEQVLTTRNEILSILAPRPIERLHDEGDSDVSKRASISGSLDVNRSSRTKGVYLPRCYVLLARHCDV